MDQRLSKLLHDYQAAVRQAVDLMTRSGILRPRTPLDRATTDLWQTGQFAGGD